MTVFAILIGGFEIEIIVLVTLIDIPEQFKSI